MSRRWRPSLGFVLGGALSGTLVLSFAGLVALRHLGPQVGFREAALLLGAVIVALTAVLGWLLVRLLLRPITALERYAVELHDGRAAPPRHFGTRELHRTARSVIDMAEALRDREATIRSFTDHVTHELRTPVSAIRAAVEILEDGGSLSATDRQVLAQLDGARAQIERQLAALRAAAQAREARYLGQTALAPVAARLAAQHPDLRLSVTGGEVAVPLSPEGLELILGHLLRNALEHGARHVTLAGTTADAGAVVTVADDGRGISPGNAPHVFEPFFTTRRESGGTGMGLAIVRNVVAAHRGEIELLSSAGGARFRLAFPVG